MVTKSETRIIATELESIRKSVETLTRLYYELAKSLLEEDKLTEKEKGAIKRARKEGLVSLDELEDQ